MKDPKQTVQKGYDQIAETYRDWAQTVRGVERGKYTQLLLTRLPQGADLLELGCGAGEPTTRLLSERFRVTGVDISPRQVELARAHVPGAVFIQSDMAELDFSKGQFDGICAFYVFNHFPREELPALLAKVALWLKPAGLFVASFGASDEAEFFEDDWLGAPTYWSSFPPDKTRQLVEAAGLEIVSAELETEDEFDDPVTFLWIVAKKS